MPLQTYSGSFIYSGLMLWLCLYPITYSWRFNKENNPVKINISSMLMSFILIFFHYHRCKILLLWSFFHQNLWSFSPFLYMIKKKSKICFIIIRLYVHWLYIFTVCLLIWLMTTKNVYSRNNNVCVVVFMRIDTFKRLLLVWNGLWGYFQICGYAFFNVVINLDSI